MTAIEFPSRFPVAGILISGTTYAEATDRIMAAARAGERALVSATAVHAVTLGATDGALREQLNQFDMLTPDGQPVRWSLNVLHATGLKDRVYGPTLMLRVCQAAAEEGLGIYLYGSRPEVLAGLTQGITRAAPGLTIAGTRASRFRPATAEEDRDDCRAIVESGARIVFVGLGCPRQETWAYEHRDRLRMPLICVGAAFDFHAGTLRQAPSWMQARGLEWLFRVAMEPRRLAGRYLKTNPLFLALIARQYVSERLQRQVARPVDGNVRGDG